MKTARFVTNYFSNEQGLAPLLLPIIIVVLIASIGGYFFMNTVNKPARIKGAVEPVQTTFTNYAQSVRAVADDLQDSSGGSDADSIERAFEKAKGYLKSAEDNFATLSPLVAKVNFSETSEYRKDLDAYLDKGSKLTQIEKDGVDVGDKLVNIIRDYQKEATDLGGVANYMYSDPEKYSQLVGDFVKKEDSLIKDAEAISAKGDAKETIDNLVKKMQIEKQLLQNMIDAVSNRDSNAIITAQKKYSQDAQDWETDNNRTEDRHKETVKTLARDLDSLKDKLTSDYSDLRSRYKF